MRSQVSRFAVGIGDNRNAVQVKILAYSQLGLCQDAVVAVVTVQRQAQVTHAEAHDEVKIGRPIDGLACQAAVETLE